MLKACGRYTYTPGGAFYLLIEVGDKLAPDSNYGVYQFAFDLLRQCNVAVAPGSAFGRVARDYVRISLGAAEQDIERGVRELCAFSRSGDSLLKSER
jgi:aspartate/methionine/tyrosine aminotransferase